MQQDVFIFFDGKPAEFSLYAALEEALIARLPQTVIRVQKSQIRFSSRYGFGSASLPYRRRKEWPENCLVVSFGLNERLESPRIFSAVEPYPQRWTHHVLISSPAEIDDELLSWLQAACHFSETKGRRR